MFGKKCCSGRQGMGMGYGAPAMGPGMNMNVMNEGQVIEPTITKCVEEECYHEVPHVCFISDNILLKAMMICLFLILTFLLQT